MKKIIFSIILSLGISAFADTATVTIAPGAFSLLSAGPIKVSQIIVTANTATNVTATLVDTATNSMTYVLSAYTNTISYLTNQPVIYTDYFGVLTTNANSGGTNMVLVDVSNTVARSTNNCPTVAVAATASSSVTVNNLSVYFFRGLWATNTGSGTATLNVTYVRQ